MKPGETKIINALITNEDGLTFTKLKEQTGLSNTGLSNYLNLMQVKGDVRKDVLTKKYVLATVNLPLKNLLNDWQRSLKVLPILFRRKGLELAKIEDKTKRKVALKSFLKFGFYWLSFASWKIIFEAIGDWEKGVKEETPNEDLVLKKSALINEAVQNWVVGIADALATAIILNVDILDSAQDAYAEVSGKVLQATIEMEAVLGRS